MNPLQTFRGTMVSLFATLTSIVVVLYFVVTFWYGRVLDIGFKVANGNPIPPETYPIILLSAWTLLQRAKAHWRPRDGNSGRFWYWEDKATAYGMSIFMGATLVWSLATGSNLTFIVVLLAFFAQAIGDAMMNGRHSYESDQSAAGNALLDPTVNVAPVERDVLVRLKPRYVVVGPDGKDVDVDPRMITMVQNTPPA